MIVDDKKRCTERSQITESKLVDYHQRQNPTRKKTRTDHRQAIMGVSLTDGKEITDHKNRDSERPRLTEVNATKPYDG